MPDYLLVEECSSSMMNKSAPINLLDIVPSLNVNELIRQQQQSSQSQTRLSPMPRLNVAAMAAADSMKEAMLTKNGISANFASQTTKQQPQQQLRHRHRNNNYHSDKSTCRLNGCGDTLDGRSDKTGPNLKQQQQQSQVGTISECPENVLSRSDSSQDNSSNESSRYCNLRVDAVPSPPSLPSSPTTTTTVPIIVAINNDPTIEHHQLNQQCNGQQRHATEDNNNNNKLRSNGNNFDNAHEDYEEEDVGSSGGGGGGGIGDGINVDADNKNVDSSGDDGASTATATADTEAALDAMAEDGDRFDVECPNHGNDNRSHQPFQDLLQLPLQQTRYENIVSRTCYYAWHVLTRRIDARYSDVQHKVLGSDRVKQAIREVSKEEYNVKHPDNAQAVANPADDEYHRLVEKHHHNAFRHLMQLRAGISSSLLRVAGWILYRLLSRIFTCVQFNAVHLDRIKACRRQSNGKNIPIIYLPIHRSHLDYILISFLLYMNNISPPLVAAGDNLMIPFFGNLLRGLGAFFIRRPDRSNRHKDPVYQAILHSYICENLREGNSLEFFIEGGRTRTGKRMTPKFGLLSVVVDALEQGVVDDVYIVPVSISYEKLIDGSFVEEQMGRPKKFENFSVAWKAIWSTLRSNFGSARIDFSKPFLMKEYLNQALVQNISHSSAIDNIGSPNATHSLNNCVACPGIPSEINNRYNRKAYNAHTGQSLASRDCIESMAKHVLYDAYKESALMSTHLVSFFLLTKYRKGVTLNKLAQDIEWLCEILYNEKGIRFNASRDFEDLIQQAMVLLGKDMISTEKVSLKWSSWPRSPPTSALHSNPSRHIPNRLSGNDLQNQYKLIDENDDELDRSRIEIVYLKPVLKLQSALNLHYYANNCIPLFQLESVFTTVLFSFINADISTLIYNPATYISNLTIDKVEFMQRCRQLCDLLQNEFYFHKSCRTLDQTLEDMYSVFIAKNIFVHCNKGTTNHSNNTSSMTLSHSGLFTNNGNGTNNGLYRGVRPKHKKSNITTLPTLNEVDSDLELESENLRLSSSDDMLIDSDKPASTRNKNEFCILLTTKNCNLLNFYSTIIGSYLEAYWLTASRLADFLASYEASQSMPILEEKVFIDKMIDYGQQLIIKEHIAYEESISCDKFKNALKYFENVKAIRRVDENDETLNSLANGSSSNSTSSSSSSSLLTSVRQWLLSSPSSNKTTITSSVSVSKSGKRPVNKFGILFDCDKMDSLVRSLEKYLINVSHNKPLAC